ncbi:MAG: gamma-glutamylcyclotransferase [Betaproteobacteria bacterium]|nr:gamma-glutamylcyclotransferase [Betaproteobacteria bacterium]
MALTREDLENDALRKQYENLRDHVPLVPEEQFNASLDATLAGWNPAEDLWVFAYGSLIWNPLIHFVEQRRALLHGFHRRFCLRSRGARGTVANPGLVLGLDFGGCCNGMAFRIEAARAQHELKMIWRREMVLGSYAPRWVNLVCDDLTVRAVAFVVNHAHPHYAGKLPADELTRILATAGGQAGAAQCNLRRNRRSRGGP